MTQGTETGSPQWHSTTKALVAISLLALVSVLLIRFREVLGMLVLAAVVAFVITPIARWLQRRARFSWKAAANITFLFMILFMMIAVTAIGLLVVQQLQALFQTTQGFLLGLPERLGASQQQSIQIGPWTINLGQLDSSALVDQILGYLQVILGQASTIITGVATIAIETVAKVIFTLIVAYFLILDHIRFREVLRRIRLPRYEADFDRLRHALGRIWDAFLRGQLLVVTISGFLTWLLMTILGVRFSLGLGVLGGLAKFIPLVGPSTAGAFAAVVALLQPSNYFHLTPLAHAILVVACVIILDQSIDYLIIPRIMGTSLNLHPAIVIIGAILGATLAGILGLLLSAPAMATLFLFAKYIYRKMTDQSPWDPPIDTLPEIQERRWLRLLQRKAKAAKKEEVPPEFPGEG
jgi:predicted PurR-regulated permease PerM